MLVSYIGIHSVLHTHSLIQTHTDELQDFRETEFGESIHFLVLASSSQETVSSVANSNLLYTCFYCKYFENAWPVYLKQLHVRQRLTLANKSAKHAKIIEFSVNFTCQRVNVLKHDFAMVDNSDLLRPVFELDFDIGGEDVRRNHK